MASPVSFAMVVPMSNRSLCCTNPPLVVWQGNGITQVTGLSHLSGLLSLDLSSNRLSRITDVHNLTALRHLALYANQLTSLSGKRLTALDRALQLVAVGSPKDVSTLTRSLLGTMPYHVLLSFMFDVGNGSVVLQCYLL